MTKVKGMVMRKNTDDATKIRLKLKNDLAALEDERRVAIKRFTESCTRIEVNLGVALNVVSADLSSEDFNNFLKILTSIINTALTDLKNPEHTEKVTLPSYSSDSVSNECGRYLETYIRINKENISFADRLKDEIKTIDTKIEAKKAELSQKFEESPQGKPLTGFARIVGLFSDKTSKVNAESSREMNPSPK